MVGEEYACRLHVAHARELQLEVDAVALALGLELRDLAAQLLGRLGVLRRLGNWASSEAIFSSRSAICFS